MEALWWLTVAPRAHASLLPPAASRAPSAGSAPKRSRRGKSSAIAYEPEPPEPKWEPENWRQQLERIREMRRARDAPVDEMGVEKCYDSSAPPQVTASCGPTGTWKHRAGEEIQGTPGLGAGMGPPEVTAHVQEKWFVLLVEESWLLPLLLLAWGLQAVPVSGCWVLSVLCSHSARAGH